MKMSTKIYLKEVKKRCKRENSKANNRLHWFSSNFSIYFSYIFLKFRFSADFVTVLFFILGFAGAILYSFNSIILSLVAYVFWRLHIIVDMSDGDVARYNKSFSIRGAYWDAVIHSILNPLYFISISYSFFIQFENNLFLIIGCLSSLSMSVLMGVKNSYYKAKFFNKETYNPIINVNSDNKSIVHKLFFVSSEILGMEGFIFLTIVVRIIDVDIFAVCLLLLYLMSNIFISGLKFYNLSYYGYYKTKN